MTIGELKGKLDGRLAGTPEQTIRCDITQKVLRADQAIYVYAAVKRGHSRPFVRILCEDIHDEQIDDPVPGLKEAVFKAKLDWSGEFVTIDASCLDVVEKSGFNTSQEE